MISNDFKYTKLLSNTDGYVRYVYWEWKFTDGINESVGAGETMIEPSILAVDATPDSIKELVIVGCGGESFVNSYSSFHAEQIAHQAELKDLVVSYDSKS